jgi:hypothetical protein
MTQWGLDTLFNPAKRHMDEEKRRLQSTREEVGDSSGGKRIDLESGKVTIRRSAKDAADDETGESADETAAESADETAETAAESADETESEADHPTT